MQNSASLYIHIPFCRKKCDYCDFFSIPAPPPATGACPSVPDSYVSALIREAGLQAQIHQIDSWNTVYIGGGTPSLLSPEQLSRLMSGVREAAPLAASAEATMEMNPESLNPALLEAAKKSGINRISLGIQALDDRALSAVHRTSTVAQAHQALSLLAERWQDAGHQISCDLIAGLPEHTMQSFLQGIDELCAYPLTHISLYTLTLEEGTPLYRRIERGEMHYKDERADRMWISGRRQLEKRGFFQYEVSNFAKPGFESRHNSAYWQLKNYIGLGAGATSSWYGSALADGREGCEEGCRWTNPAHIASYIAGSSKAEYERLSSDTQRFEYLMMGFRMLAGLSSLDYRRRFNASLESAIGVEGGVYADWKRQGLTGMSKRPPAEGTEADCRYALNRRGILLLNRFLEALM